MKLYAIYDVTAEQGSNIFEAKNDGVALRQFDRLTRDSDFAVEFQLWCYGEYKAECNPEHGDPVVAWKPVQVKPSVEADDEQDI